jgi:hypothetical protein
MSMNAGQYIEAGKSLAIGGAVIALGIFVYRSGVGSVLFKAVDKAADVAGGALENVGTSASAMWGAWEHTTGKGLQQLGEIANGNFGQAFGSSVEATSAYVIVRKRDFNSDWKMSESAYRAAVGMHKDNKAILQTYVLNGMGLKPNLQNLVKLTDYVAVFKDGSMKSA